MNKRDQLNALISSSDADLIILTETWLNAKIRNAEIFQVDKRYNLYRCDRDGRHGGGTLIAVSQNIPSFPIPLVTDLEIVCVCTTFGNTRIVVIACYRPPSAPSTFVEELHDVLNAIVCRYPSLPIILLGDFNFPNIDWSNSFPTLKPFSSQSQSFLDLCACFNFTQLVKEPTRLSGNTANTLDLILSTHPDFVSSISYLPGISDHSVLHFNLQFSFKRLQQKLKLIRDYSKADFDVINLNLGSYLDTYLERFDDRSVQENWNLFLGKITELTNAHVPLRRIRSDGRSPWYNRTLTRLLNKKKRLFRKAKFHNTSDRWASYFSAQTEYTSSVQHAKRHFLNNTLPDILRTNPKKFWSIVNTKENHDIVLFDDTGEPVPPAKCVSVLNNVFVHNFCSAVLSSIPDLVPSSFCAMSPVVFESVGIVKIIDSLKLTSSCGIDGINAKFLKQTKNYSSIFLAKIFQQSLNSGILPRDWKIGKVVPLHKSGNRHSPLNYRPISLTSIPCKIMEHVLYSHICNFLEFNCFFNSAQHGFRRSFSCETQLLHFTHSLHTYLDSNSLVDCIFLDFAKAFDKVNHVLLMTKLAALNLDPQLLLWLEHFLNNRSQYVTLNGFDSQLNEVTSGVPQGSVLGPLLFLIYINDLSNHVSSSMHLYADDCVIYRQIRCDDDNRELQSDLNKIVTWCETWKMVLNPLKCKVMRISRRDVCSPFYTLTDVPLENVSSYRYLGVTLSSDLTWKLHIDSITSNANRMLGYLRRNFSQAPVSLKLTLYRTLIRSKLEYAASIWDPSQANLIQSLELVQNNAVRFILSNYQRAASVTSMKSSLSLPLLTLRRRYFRLCLFHKVYNHNLLRSLLIPPPFYRSSRIDHMHKVGITHCQTNTFFHSFLPCTSNDWNRLPADIASITDHTLFRSSLYAYLVPDDQS